jgi:hypothetical protein
VAAEEGLPKVVSLGGLDVLIYLCSSPLADVATAATTVLETLARRGTWSNATCLSLSVSGGRR